ncbi:MAG: MCE family protein [Candidatus Latescibacteria bacterium]|nr:MCE family protein [Candidatus Latescibacterota bacterium]
MATKAQKVRLALFFLVSSSILLLFVLMIAGAHLFKTRTLYSIEFRNQSVGGLKPGAQVNFEGITIGRVEDMEISQTDIGTIIVYIAIDPDRAGRAITTSTRAVINNRGLTGIKSIELTPGSGAGEPLPEGAKIPPGDTFLGSFEERAEILTNKIEEGLNRAISLLKEENRAQVARILENVGGLTQQANSALADNRPQIDSTIANLNLASRELAGAAQALHASIDTLHQLIAGPRTQQTLSNLQALVAQTRRLVEGPVPQLIASLHQTSTDIDRTFLHVDQTMQQSRNSFINAMQDVEEATENLRETTELIRDNPSILIRGGASAE